MTKSGDGNGDVCQRGMCPREGCWHIVTTSIPSHLSITSCCVSCAVYLDSDDMHSVRWLKVPETTVLTHFHSRSHSHSHSHSHFHSHNSDTRAVQSTSTCVT